MVELVNGQTTGRGAGSATATFSWVRSRPRRATGPSGTWWGLALGAIGLAAVAACWDDPTHALDPVPVVSLTLVDGDPLQVASVTITTPGDSAIPRGGVPASAASVDLELADDSGHVWRLDPTGTAGRFAAAMTVRRGARYHLRGTVLDRAVLEEARAPVEFAMTRPASDTIRVTDTAPCAERSIWGDTCVPVALVDSGAVSVWYVISDTGFAQPFPVLLRGDQVHLERSDRVRDLVVMAVYYTTAAGAAVTSVYDGGAIVTFRVMLVVRRKLYIP